MRSRRRSVGNSELCSNRAKKAYASPARSAPAPMPSIQIIAWFFRMGSSVSSRLYARRRCPRESVALPTDLPCSRGAGGAGCCEP